MSTTPISPSIDPIIKAAQIMGVPADAYPVELVLPAGRDIQPDENGEFPTPADGAKFMASLGIPQVPLSAPTDIHFSKPGKNPAINGNDWQEKATTDFAQIDRWAVCWPGCNFGSLAKFQLDGFYVLETDSSDLAEEYNRKTGREIQAQLVIESSAPDRNHRWYRHSSISLAELQNIGQKDERGFSLRCDNEQAVSPGSIHASGKQYRVIYCGSPAAQPVGELRWLSAQKRRSAPRTTGTSCEKTLIPPGGHHAALLTELGHLVRRGYSKESAYSALLLWAQEWLESPGHGEPLEDHVRKMVDSADAWERGNPGAGHSSAETITEEPAGERLPVSGTADQDSSLRPKLSNEALYGLAGDIVKKILPETESHPAGLLVQTLMYFGNIIGRTAYYQVESTRHYGNLFAVLVGVSSKARKGTGADRINAVFENVDHQWFATRRRTGLSSGEGLIVAVQNAILGEDGASRPIIIEPEAHDKRLMVFEGEFGQVLAVMQRQGATISTNLRNAWDGKPLETMTIRPRTATDHTISILGDITAPELKSMLAQRDSTNGFANRFLWVHVERTKLLPFGGEDLEFAPEAERLREAVEFATQRKRVFMDRNAREMWARVYEGLSLDHGGLFGAVTSRGEAQVIRLALLYAMMDRSEHIQSKHLQAALALWQYCEDSARHIFDALTADQQSMLDGLRDGGPKTKTQFLNFFGRNRKAEAIQLDLDALMRRHLIGITNTNPPRYHVWGTTNQAEKSS